jgi:predicted transcriptional regulator
MTDECGPILVTGDGGEVLDETADGAVVCVEDGDGLTIHVDAESELGERLTWYAGHRGESPEALLADAIREQIERERQQRSTLDEFGIVRANESGDDGA